MHKRDARCCGDAPFQNVEEACQIGIKIGMRILQRVPHAGLRGEVHYRPEAATLEQGFGRSAIGKIEPMEAEIPKLPQDSKPRPVERWAVVGGDAIDTDQCTAIL